MKKYEKIVIIILLIISLLGCFYLKMHKSNYKEVVVKDSDGILLTFNLYDDNYYELNVKNGLFHIEVKNGKCRAIEVDCPNQICVHTGWISEENPLPIVCLPNGIMVIINE